LSSGFRSAAPADEVDSGFNAAGGLVASGVVSTNPPFDDERLGAEGGVRFEGLAGDVVPGSSGKPGLLLFEKLLDEAPPGNGLTANPESSFLAVGCAGAVSVLGSTGLEAKLDAESAGWLKSGIRKLGNLTFGEASMPATEASVSAASGWPESSVPSETSKAGISSVESELFREDAW
jgi:hypothetical protein